jgi:hypothetical protein
MVKKRHFKTCIATAAHQVKAAGLKVVSVVRIGRRLADRATATVGAKVGNGRRT